MSRFAEIGQLFLEHGHGATPSTDACSISVIAISARPCLPSPVASGRRTRIATHLVPGKRARKFCDAIVNFDTHRRAIPPPLPIRSKPAFALVVHHAILSELEEVTFPQRILHRPNRAGKCAGKRSRCFASKCSRSGDTAGFWCRGGRGRIGFEDAESEVFELDGLEYLRRLHLQSQEAGRVTIVLVHRIDRLPSIDEDLKAIFTYLQSVKGVNNVVPPPVAPDKI